MEVIQASGFNVGGIVDLPVVGDEPVGTPMETRMMETGVERALAPAIGAAVKSGKQIGYRCHDVSLSSPG